MCINSISIEVFVLHNKIMEVKSALKALEDKEAQAMSDNNTKSTGDDIRDKRTSEDLLRDNSEADSDRVDTTKPPKKRSKTASKPTARSTTKSASKSKRKKRDDDNFESEDYETVKPKTKSTAKSASKPKRKKKVDDNSESEDNEAVKPSTKLTAKSASKPKQKNQANGDSESEGAEDFDGDDSGSEKDSINYNNLNADDKIIYEST